MEMQRTMEGLREEMQIEREKGGLRFEEESVDKNEESFMMLGKNYLLRVHNNLRFVRLKMKCVK